MSLVHYLFPAGNRNRAPVLPDTSDSLFYRVLSKIPFGDNLQNTQCRIVLLTNVSVIKLRIEPWVFFYVDYPGYTRSYPPTNRTSLIEPTTAAHHISKERRQKKKKGNHRHRIFVRKYACSREFPKRGFETTPRFQSIADHN